MTAPYARSVHGPLVDTSGAAIAADPQCARCGCTESHACEGGCSWVSTEPRICSRCAPAPVFNESIGGALIDSARISVIAALSVLPNSAPIILSPLEPDAPSLHDCLEQAMQWLDAARVQTIERGAPVTSLHTVERKEAEGLR